MIKQRTTIDTPGDLIQARMILDSLALEYQKGATVADCKKQIDAEIRRRVSDNEVIPDYVKNVDFMNSHAQKVEQAAPKRPAPPAKPGKDKQIVTIAKALERRERLTPVIAAERYTVGRLASRIEELRNDYGYTIQSEPVAGKRYVNYKLVEVGRRPW